MKQLKRFRSEWKNNLIELKLSAFKGKTFSSNDDVLEFLTEQYNSIIEITYHKLNTLNQ